MSIETWKQEFYAVEARVVGNDTDVVLLEHSIKKWEGLQLESLERHKLIAFHNGDVVLYIKNKGEQKRTNRFFIDGASCALCAKYLHVANEPSCVSCPLSKVRGNVECDEKRKEEKFSPFLAWTEDAYPEPMLHWLRKALKVAMLKEGK